MKIKLLFIASFVFSFFTTSLNAQTQLGTDINGELAGDESGSRVSISRDGTTLAIGAYKNDGNGNSSGHARIYRYNGTNWIKLGADLDGEAAVDQFGIGISLSDDGNIVAIGSNQNSQSAPASGHVRIYSYNGTEWVQLGADIDGLPHAENLSVPALSADGTIVAIGALNHDGTGDGIGRVVVYNYDGSQWVQMGNNIYGEANADFSGESVSIAANGLRLAIGATGNDDNGSSSGQVRVYDYNGTNWVQTGNDINGEGISDFSGYVSFSGDGTTLAVGARFNNGNGVDSGQVKVYRYNGTNWVRIGNNIYGEAAGDALGSSVSLSFDGTILAAGAPRNNGNGTRSGSTRIYQYNGTNWIQRGIDINGEAADDYSGFGVSLSSNGTRVAIGALLNDGNGTDSGHVRVYNLSAILSSDSFVLENFKIFPNPTSEKVIITLQENLQLEKVTIYNTLGQFIKTEKNNIINVTGFAKGSYFFEIITNKGKATKTIVIQ
ncbi:Por secretion system C-terminal sorting domain-containing protein [Flavobacterium swingsii]|jgi:hypothetical protein|uniref:Por secretion system C-terminal sorting domain-containing protein n=1 Tax=Flavobacterium swingsii TaxID=498292 RepID=A0A1I0Y5I5_9FLAO|nr:T9SS type A sorting domain-containing protein [Flavobacterium swingsii]SFB08549.1 Por secretion system C-terminal sorting domain-containing protein [Flavobacterium swingsii]